jgi:SAM-dependent methyltransferase
VTLDEIAALEDAWRGRVQVTEPERYFGWEPAPPDRFSRFLAAVLPHVPASNRTFLEVGCGIGTKCLIAADAGLAVYGFDRVPEYTAEARRLGVEAWVGLAQEFTGYGRFGLVYFNHPMVCGPGCEDEAELEHLIHQQMAPGSVLMAANYDLAPGCSVHPPSEPCTDACPWDAAGWVQVARLGPWDAAWVKP